MTPTYSARQSAPVVNEQEVQMHTQTARTRIWLTELARIQAEIEEKGMPETPRPARKQARKLKPLWEE